MPGLASNLNAIAISAGKTLQSSSGSAVNIVICLLTIGSEQLFSFAAFNCPCQDHDELANSNEATATTVSGMPAIKKKAATKSEIVCYILLRPVRAPPIYDKLHTRRVKSVTLLD